jgi:hypothetical protein
MSYEIDIHLMKFLIIKNEVNYNWVRPKGGHIYVTQSDVCEITQAYEIRGPRATCSPQSSIIWPALLSIILKIWRHDRTDYTPKISCKIKHKQCYILPSFFLLGKTFTRRAKWVSDTVCYSTVSSGISKMARKLSWVFSNQSQRDGNNKIIPTRRL